MSKVFAAALGAFSALAFVANAGAASIGLNIQGGGGPAIGTVSAGTSMGVTGVYQQANWNNFAPAQSGSTGGLKYTYTGPFIQSDTTATALQVVWAGSGPANNWTNKSTDATVVRAPADSGPRSGTGAADGNLFGGYFYAGSGQSNSLRFSNIPYSNYDIVVYTGSSGNPTTATVATTVGATTFDANGLPTDGTTTNFGSFRSFYLDTWTAASSTTTGNYFVLPGLSGASQILTMTTTAGSQFQPVAFQIVNAVPEPTSIALAGVAGLGLLARRRRAEA